MQLTQDKFDQIVNALVDQIDAKHAHVETATLGGPAVPFHLGYTVASDALQVALEAHGVSVIEADAPVVELDDAIELLRRLRRDLMSARRFQPDVLQTYRRACTSAECDIEEFLSTAKAAGVI